MINTKNMIASKVTPKIAFEILNKEDAILIDVRGLDEFAAVHAPGAICIPLNTIEQRLENIPSVGTVLVMCHLGGRSAVAVNKLKMLGRNNVVDIEGGMNAWRQAGLPIEKTNRVIPLERQMRITAGLLVFIFSLLGLFINVKFLWGDSFIGFMLSATGILGICPMISLLKLLPWNRQAATCTTEK